MLNLGCHLTSSKGYENMGKEALHIDANTLQFFTRNPRGGKAKAIDPEDIKRFSTIMKENKFTKIVAHARYTLSLIHISSFGTAMLPCNINSGYHYDDYVFRSLCLYGKKG